MRADDHRHRLVLGRQPIRTTERRHNDRSADADSGDRIALAEVGAAQVIDRLRVVRSGRVGWDKQISNIFRAFVSPEVYG